MNKERIVKASPDETVLFDSSVRALNGKDPFSEASKILIGIEETPPNVKHDNEMDSHECQDLLSRIVEDMKK
jgi:hypothetical protein